MADDLSTRLAAALDRAETEARNVAPGFAEALDIMVTMSGGHDDIAEFASDWGPGAALRLIERDRALLAELADAEACLADPTSALAESIKLARWHRAKATRVEVERAAAFWSPVVPDAR